MTTWGLGTGTGRWVRFLLFRLVGASVLTFLLPGRLPIVSWSR